MGEGERRRKWKQRISRMSEDSEGWQTTRKTIRTTRKTPKGGKIVGH